MTPGGCTAFGRLPFSDRQSPQRTWWKGEQPVFEHLIAAVAKFFFAAGLVAGASGAGNVDLPEWHLPKAPVHTEKTHEPQASPEATKTPERYSFESLLKECVTRYTGHLDGAKDVCTAAIAASGLEADAFWAKYRSLLVKELPKTEPTTSFEALVRSFNESCRTTPDNKSTTTPKPVATPKPAPTVQLSAACVAKYEAAKAAKNGPADVFEALVRAFKDSCLVTTEVKS